MRKGHCQSNELWNKRQQWTNFWEGGVHIWAFPSTLIPSWTELNVKVIKCQTAHAYSVIYVLFSALSRWAGTLKKIYIIYKQLLKTKVRHTKITHVWLFSSYQPKPLMTQQSAHSGTSISCHMTYVNYSTHTHTHTHTLMMTFIHAHACVRWCS